MPKNHKVAHPNSKSRPSTDVDMAQAHLGTNHAKVVVRRAIPGAAALPLAPLDLILHRWFIQCARRLVA
jgi:hypothetical protein